jgi:hypothetical protein
MAKARGDSAARVYQTLPLAAPTGGLDLRTSLTQMGDDRARMVANVSLSEPGVFVSRAGFRTLTTDTGGILPPDRIQGALRAYFRTSTPSAVSTTATIWAKGGEIGLSNSADMISLVSDGQIVGAFDGVSTLARKSTNGSSWTRFGIAPGSTGPTLSTLSTGGLSSGEYAVSWTYKDRDLAYESNGPAGSTITLSASSGAINVVIPNSTDAQVEAFIVYARKVSAGETVLRKVSSQAQSSGVSSTLVLTSTAWTTGAEIPTTHTLPPTLSFGTVWKNRWWARDASVANRLRFSEIFLPQAWPANYYVDLPFEKGDEIRAVHPFGDTLLVLGAGKVFIVLGTTTTDFEIRPALGSRDGAFGPRAVCSVDNGVVHAGANGVHWFDGTADTLLSDAIDPMWQEILNAAPSSLTMQTAIVEDRRSRELRITSPGFDTLGKGYAGEWVLDLAQFRMGKTAVWSMTDRQIGGYLPYDGPEGASSLQNLLLSYYNSTAPAVYTNEESTGDTANGAPMLGQWISRAVGIGAHAANWVDVRGEYDPRTSTNTLNVQAWVDGIALASVPCALSSAAPSSVYDARRQFYTPLPLSRPGRTLGINISAPAPFRISNIDLGFVPEPKPRQFSR